MKRITLSAICLLFACHLMAQTAVVSTKNRNSVKGDPAVSYFLPRTILQIEVEAEQIIRETGPFYKEARKYLGEPAAIQQNEEIWQIKEIKVKQKSEPDAANQYEVYAAVNSNATLLTLTEDGILRGINLPASFALEEKKADITESDKKDPRVKKSEEKINKSDFVTNYLIENANSDDISGSEAAFDQINDLREMRMSLLLQDGDVIQDGNALKAYLDEIDKREKELTALFNGKESTRIIQKTFIVYPDKEMTNQEIFRFSEKQGSDASGEPVTITLKKRAIGVKPAYSGKGKQGFVYRLPALVEIEINKGKITYWKSEMNIAQLGSLAHLPTGLFDKNDVKALFDTKSGALLQLGK